MRSFQPGRPGLLQRAQHQHQRARVGFPRVLVAEGFDAGLTELARVRSIGARGLKAEGRPVVAVVGFAVGRGMPLQIETARRHREVRPQAQLLAVHVGEHVGAPAQRLADDIQEDAGRLDDLGRNGLVAGGDEHRQQRTGLRLECLEICRRRRNHDRARVLVSVKGAVFWTRRRGSASAMMPVGRSADLG